jgi:hypothetical protein
MNKMPCHITDFDDEPPEHEDEEVRDALTQDDSLRIRQKEILMDIALSHVALKKAIKVQAE